jgi:hypothetical protein
MYNGLIQPDVPLDNNNKICKMKISLKTNVFMSSCTSCPTPLSTTDTLALSDGSPLGSEDITRYMSIVGAL